MSEKAQTKGLSRVDCVLFSHERSTLACLIMHPLCDSKTYTSYRDGNYSYARRLEETLLRGREDAPLALLNRYFVVYCGFSILNNAMSRPTFATRGAQLMSPNEAHR